MPLSLPSSSSSSDTPDPAPRNLGPPPALQRFTWSQLWRHTFTITLSFLLAPLLAVLCCAAFLAITAWKVPVKLLWAWSYFACGCNFSRLWRCSLEACWLKAALLPWLLLVAPLVLLLGLVWSALVVLLYGWVIAFWAGQSVNSPRESPLHAFQHCYQLTRYMERWFNKHFMDEERGLLPKWHSPIPGLLKRLRSAHSNAFEIEESDSFMSAQDVDLESAASGFQRPSSIAGSPLGEGVEQALLLEQLMLIRTEQRVLMEPVMLPFESGMIIEPKMIMQVDQKLLMQPGAMVPMEFVGREVCACATPNNHTDVSMVLPPQQVMVSELVAEQPPPEGAISSGRYPDIDYLSEADSLDSSAADELQEMESSQVTLHDRQGHKQVPPQGRQSTPYDLHSCASSTTKTVSDVMEPLELGSDSDSDSGPTHLSSSWWRDEQAQHRAHSRMAGTSNRPPSGIMEYDLTSPRRSLVARARGSFTLRMRVLNSMSSLNSSLFALNSIPALNSLPRLPSFRQLGTRLRLGATSSRGEGPASPGQEDLNLKTHPYAHDTIPSYPTDDTSPNHVISDTMHDGVTAPVGMTLSGHISTPSNGPTYSILGSCTFSGECTTPADVSSPAVIAGLCYYAASDPESEVKQTGTGNEMQQGGPGGNLQHASTGATVQRGGTRVDMQRGWQRDVGQGAAVHGEPAESSMVGFGASTSAAHLFMLPRAAGSSSSHFSDLSVEQSTCRNGVTAPHTSAVIRGENMQTSAPSVMPAAREKLDGCVSPCSSENAAQAAVVAPIQGSPPSARRDPNIEVAMTVLNTPRTPRSEPLLNGRADHGAAGATFAPSTPGTPGSARASLALSRLQQKRSRRLRHLNSAPVSSSSFSFDGILGGEVLGHGAMLKSAARNAVLISAARGKMLSKAGATGHDATGHVAGHSARGNSATPNSPEHSTMPNSCGHSAALNSPEHSATLNNCGQSATVNSAGQGDELNSGRSQGGWFAGASSSWGFGNRSRGNCRSQVVYKDPAGVKLEDQETVSKEQGQYAVDRGPSSEQGGSMKQGLCKEKVHYKQHGQNVEHLSVNEGGMQNDQGSDGEELLLHKQGYRHQQRAGVHDRAASEPLAALKRYSSSGAGSFSSWEVPAGHLQGSCDPSDSGTSASELDRDACDRDASVRDAHIRDVHVRNAANLVYVSQDSPLLQGVQQLLNMAAGTSMDTARSADAGPCRHADYKQSAKHATVAKHGTHPKQVACNMHIGDARHTMQHGTHNKHAVENEHGIDSKHAIDDDKNAVEIEYDAENKQNTGCDEKGATTVQSGNAGKGPHSLPELSGSSVQDTEAAGSPEKEGIPSAGTKSRLASFIFNLSHMPSLPNLPSLPSLPNLPSLPQLPSLPLMKSVREGLKGSREGWNGSQQESMSFGSRQRSVSFGSCWGMGMQQEASNLPRDGRFNCMRCAAVDTREALEFYQWATCLPRQARQSSPKDMFSREDTATRGSPSYADDTSCAEGTSSLEDNSIPGDISSSPENLSSPEDISSPKHVSSHAYSSQPWLNGNHTDEGNPTTLTSTLVQGTHPCMNLAPVQGTNLLARSALVEGVTPFVFASSAGADSTCSNTKRGSKCSKPTSTTAPGVVTSLRIAFPFAGSGPGSNSCGVYSPARLMDTPVIDPSQVTTAHVINPSPVTTTYTISVPLVTTTHVIIPPPAFHSRVITTPPLSYEPATTHPDPGSAPANWAPARMLLPDLCAGGFQEVGTHGGDTKLYRRAQVDSWRQRTLVSDFDWEEEMLPEFNPLAGVGGKNEGVV